MNKYYDKHYHMAAESESDKIILKKCGRSDWCEVIMEINGDQKCSMDIRSREMAEQLHFMLGQILSQQQ